jgi:hypothetical protein
VGRWEGMGCTFTEKLIPKQVATITRLRSKIFIILISAMPQLLISSHLIRSPNRYCTSEADRYMSAIFSTSCEWSRHLPSKSFLKISYTHLAILEDLMNHRSSLIRHSKVDHTPGQQLTPHS